MDFEEVRNHCLSKPGTTESFPFDEETLVFKVASKIYCLGNLTPPLKLNLKCDPVIAIELREEYEEIISSYHMNKNHWNTVDLEGKLSNTFIKQLIDDSYILVFEKLTKREKQSLQLSQLCKITNRSL